MELQVGGCKEDPGCQEVGLQLLGEEREPVEGRGESRREGNVLMSVAGQRHSCRSHRGAQVEDIAGQSPDTQEQQVESR